jgi:uncharacterized protein YaiE (UPF0345 family)
MALSPRNLEKLVFFPLHPAASEATTFTGATTNIADLQQLDGDIVITLDAGAAAASGTMTGVIQDSADGSTDWQTVTGGSFTAVAQAASFQQLVLTKDSLRRYIRFVGTIANSGTTVYSVQGIGVRKYG